MKLNAKIRTKILIEHFAGDCMKVIGEMTHQLSDFDKLQNAEILSLIRAELEQRPLANKRRALRPRPTGVFKAAYHSGNELTRSLVVKEKGLVERLEVIYQMCQQLSSYDGLKPHQILSLIDCYLKEHILEVDV